MPITDAPHGADARPDGEFCSGGRHGRGVRGYANLRENPELLNSGVWAVVGEFDGPLHAWQMEAAWACDGACVIALTGQVRWDAPAATGWESTLTEREFRRHVAVIQRRIQAGELEQVNLCRVLTAPTPRPPAAHAVHQRLAAAHPAPHSGWFDFPPRPAADAPDPGAWLVSASPELSLEIAAGVLRSSPIKGTAPTRGGLLAKDYAENRLVTAHLRERVGRVCSSLKETRSCDVEEHPGLVQLVSTLEGRLRRDPVEDPAEWGKLLSLLHPPLSVSGVPQQQALELIAALEPAARGPYCGSSGWIDVDAGSCVLGVTIRSFWWDRGALKFGTGAGITSGSSPATEWEETELKAHRLLQVLAGEFIPSPGAGPTSPGSSDTRGRSAPAS